MNKKYFITGVSDGLGKELCKNLLLKGNIAYGISRRECNMGGEFKDSFIWKHCDISNPSEIQEIIEHQNSIGFIPDVVILNAGIYKKEGQDFIFDDYMNHFKVNAEGALRWIEFYLPIFKKRNSGHFVYISTLSAIFPYPYRAAYAASKRYVCTVFSSLNKQYSDNNIIFTTIYPGLLDTKMSAGIKAPSFLKYNISKAADKVIKAISKKKSVYFFPIFNLFRSIILYYLVPDKLLLKLITERDKS
jgi:short-subunit dehydrogenase